jgi:hypothetical protein
MVLAVGELDLLEAPAGHPLVKGPLERLPPERCDKRPGIAEARPQTAVHAVNSRADPSVPARWARRQLAATDFS